MIVKCNGCGDSMPVKPGTDVVRMVKRCAECEKARAIAMRVWAEILRPSLLGRQR